MRIIHGLLLGSLLPLSAHAVTTVESEQIGSFKQGGSGEVEAVLDGRHGNTDRSFYDIGGRLNYQARDTLMFITGEYARAKADDFRIEENTWLHAHYRDEFQHGLAAEAFVDYLEDDFRAIDNRTQLGANVRFTLDYLKDERAVYAGVGAAYEWIDKNAAVNGSDDYWRLHSYLAYKRAVTPKTHILYNISYQPRLDEASDYLLTNVLALGVDITPSVSLQLGLKHEYDSEPAPGIKSSDTRYQTALRLRF